MTTTPIYDHIVATIPAGLERDVYNAVKEYVGKDNAISLDDLTVKVFGQSAYVFVVVKGEPRATVSESKKRQVREVILTLRKEHRVPVCSNSGQAGRYLPANKDELKEFIAEHRSRANEELETAQTLERIGAEWFSRPHTPVFSQPKQMTLMEVMG